MNARKLIKKLEKIDPEAIVYIATDPGFYPCLEYWDGESGDWIIIWEDSNG